DTTSVATRSLLCAVRRVRLIWPLSIMVREAICANGTGVPPITVVSRRHSGTDRPAGSRQARLTNDFAIFARVIMWNAGKSWKRRFSPSSPGSIQAFRTPAQSFTTSGHLEGHHPHHALLQARCVEPA